MLGQRQTIVERATTDVKADSQESVGMELAPAPLRDRDVQKNLLNVEFIPGGPRQVNLETTHLDREGLFRRPIPRTNWPKTLLILSCADARGAAPATTLLRNLRPAREEEPRNPFLAFARALPSAAAVVGAGHWPPRGACPQNPSRHLRRPSLLRRSPLSLP